MTIAIETMAPEHTDGAARLLAARQRAARRHDSALPHEYEDEGTTRPIIAAALATEGAGGVAAMEGGRMVGYAIGRPLVNRPLLWPRPAGIEFGDHATRDEGGAEAYCALYAALARCWAEEGYFSHYVFVPASDRTALGAWRSLRFGLEDVRGLRDLAPLDGPAGMAGVQIWEAAPEDAKAAVGLLRRLALHHTGPPVLEAFPPEVEAGLREHLVESLADPASHVLLALRDGRAVGFLSMVPAGGRAPLVTPAGSVELGSAYVDPAERGTGLAVLLVNEGLTWARERGYEACTIGWRTANLVAARFWPAAGFRPVAYRLSRHLDARIAWARPAD